MVNECVHAAYIRPTLTSGFPRISSTVNALLPTDLHQSTQQLVNLLVGISVDSSRVTSKGWNFVRNLVLFWGRNITPNSFWTLQEFLWIFFTEEIWNLLGVTFFKNICEELFLTLNVRNIVRNFFLSPIRIALEMQGSSFLTDSSMGTGATFSPPAVIKSSLIRPESKWWSMIPPLLHLLYSPDSKQFVICTLDLK